MTDLSPAAPPREPVTIEETCPNHTMKDLRTLCDEAIQFWDACCDMDDVISEMRAYLAQPVQPGPTDQELREMWLGKKWFNEGATYREFASICRAALARWGK